MPTLFDQLNTDAAPVVEVDIEAIQDTYVALLWRAENPEPDDATTLAEILTTLAMTPAQARADYIALQEWQKLAKAAEDAEAAWLALGQARADVDAAGGRVATGPTLPLAQALDAAENRHRKATAAKAALNSHIHPSHRHLWAHENGAIVRPLRPRVLPS